MRPSIAAFQAAIFLSAGLLLGQNRGPTPSVSRSARMAQCDAKGTLDDAAIRKRNSQLAAGSE
jgi:hypothetical protein